MNTKTPANPLVFSYIRFSTLEQRKGSGEARQIKLAEAWCAKHNLTLCQSYKDLGLSAWKGKNAATGQLAAILKAIQERKIPAGSILIVESLDRISRQQVNKALELFLSIINAGVDIVTLCDEQRYSASNADMSQMMISIAIMCRASDESKMKSQRKAGSWAIKRQQAQENGKPLGCKTPAWIKITNGEYRVIESEAQKIRDIFNDYNNGMGIYLLNKKYRVPKPTISYWLGNPIVIGTVTVTENGKPYQIANHYPAIIDLATWREAQQRKAERFIPRKNAGRTGNVNIFAGLLFSPKGQRFDVNRFNGQNFSAYVAEGIVLHQRYLECVVCAEKLIDKFVTTTYTEDDAPSPEMEKLQKKIADLQRAMMDGDEVAELLPVLRDAKTRLKTLQQDQSKGTREVVSYDLIIKLLTDENDQQARLQLREICKQTIERIEITNYHNNNWYVMVQGKVMLKAGASIPFGFAYCTRRNGYIMTDGTLTYRKHPVFQINGELVENTHRAKQIFRTTELTEELKQALHDLPPRPKAA